MRPTRPLEVLLVAPFGVLGGAESWLLSVLDGQPADAPHARFSAILLADGPFRAELERRGVAVTVHHTGSSGLAVIGAVRWLRAQLRRRDPDVVLANGVKAAAAACPAAAWAGVRSVWVKHDHSFDGRLTAGLGALATSVIATVADVGTAAGRDDVVVLEPPRPDEPLPIEQATQRLARVGVPRQGDTRLLVMLGRLVPYKGIDTAIAALAEPGGQGWRLAALGGDEPARPGERRRLTELAARLGVADRVTLPGHVEGAARLLRAADAVAMLTRPDGPRSPGREGFGMAALEAMVAGVPVIALDDGGPVARRTAGHGVDPAAGLLTDGSPHDVAAALAALSDPARAVALGSAGASRVRHHPDAAQLSRRCIEVLALAAHRPGAGVAGGPAISIVTPVLNEIAVLDRLVPPIVAGMGPDDEYLLVDSGSVDGTREALATWSANDARIRLISTDGGSIARSRNVGIAAARHQFVACTDAGCAPDDTWVAGMRAAAAHTERARAGGHAGHADGKPPELYVGVYRVAVRPGRLFEQAMAAVSWPDPAELRRPTLGRRLYGRLLGRRFDSHRVDGRSVGFTAAAWRAAGGFPEHLRTAEDEAFGRAVLATGARSALTLDAGVTWFQRGSIAATFRQFRGYGRGGGASRSFRLLLRDGVRVAAYGIAATLVVVGGWWGIAAVTLGATAYLWLPLTRLARRGHWGATPLVPFCAIGKDLAKVLGTAEALLRGVMSRPADNAMGDTTHPATGNRPDKVSSHDN